MEKTTTSRKIQTSDMMKDDSHTTSPPEVGKRRAEPVTQQAAVAQVERCHAPVVGVVAVEGMCAVGGLVGGGGEYVLLSVEGGFHRAPVLSLKAASVPWALAPCCSANRLSDCHQSKQSQPCGHAN